MVVSMVKPKGILQLCKKCFYSGVHIRVFLGFFLFRAKVAIIHKTM